MNKRLVLLTIFALPLLASCNKSSIDMPKSPFDDHYHRIGMKGEYAKADDMTVAEYNAIKEYVNTEGEDKYVSSYHRQEEIRDLKYAYFGKESSTISQCSMTSHNEDLKRYYNRVFINNDVTDKQIQTANGGIQKTKSTLVDYTFDTTYESIEQEAIPPSGNYAERIRTTNNNEPEIITEPVPVTSYTSNEVYKLFGLKPFNSRIRSHFATEPDPTTGYDFRLLGDNNNAVYFKTKDNKYLIKEGYSLFSEFHTTMGRSYKAQDNYFYEGLLEDDDNNSYRFTHFRFYHELLILSKSIDGSGVPVIYLDKPVLIEFSETTYSDIQYVDEEKSLPHYENDPPMPPHPTEE